MLVSLQLFDGKKIWINFISYADRLFSGGRNDLWSNPDTFISVYSQGQGLIRSDVLGIPIVEVYGHFLKRDKEIYKAWVGRKPTYALKKLLALEEPKNYVKEVLSGLQNLYQESLPVALVLPSPETWVHMIHEKVNPGEELDMTDRLVEAASMYLAELLRSFSTYGLSAIVIKEESSSMQRISLYEPLINVSRHYKWVVGLELPGVDNELEEQSERIDFYLIRECSLQSIQSFDGKNVIIGGGLNTNFWTKNELVDEVPKTLIYGEIPKYAQPESVLSQLKKLRVYN